MSQKTISVVLAALFLVSILAACGSGGGSAGPVWPNAPATGGSPGTGGGGPTAPPPGNGAGVAVFSWDAPTTNADGSNLTDLAGYKIHYGAASGTYSDTIDVGNVTTYTISNMGPGTYYAAVTAYNAAGAESEHSNEAVKTIL